MLNRKNQVENNLFEQFKKKLKKNNKRFVNIVPKCLVAITFCLGGKQVYQDYKNAHALPYNDGQEIPVVDENITEEELAMAVSVYKNLINKLIQDAAKLQVNVYEDSYIKFLLYDEMTSTVDIVLESENHNHTHLKYLSEDTKFREGSLLDQLSQLFVLIKNSSLIDLPQQNSFEKNLNTKLMEIGEENVNYFANSKTQFSSGSSRTEIQHSGIVAGRDYYYFNVYGMAQKDGQDYNVVTSIAIKSDDYEILEITDLVDYYKNNTNDSVFVINTLLQEKIYFLDMLNNEITNNLQN